MNVSYRGRYHFKTHPSSGSVSENPVIGLRASGFGTGKDKKQAISSMQPDAIQSQNKPLEARSDSPTGV